MKKCFSQRLPFRRLCTFVVSSPSLASYVFQVEQHDDQTLYQLSFSIRLVVVVVVLNVQ